MKYYYYGKDNEGKETVYALEDSQLLEDKEKLLKSLEPEWSMKNYMKYGADPVSGDRFWGYCTWDEAWEDQWRNPYATAYLKEIDAAVEGGMEYPFWMLMHKTDNPAEKYEAVTQEEYERRIIELITEYAEGKYEISPRYYAEDEITVEEARKLGMNALAEYLEE